MARFVPKIPVWVVLLLCAVVIAALAPLAITKKYERSNTLICNQCGVKFLNDSYGFADAAKPLIETRSYEHTELSRWFNDHISTNCQHTWQTNAHYARTYMSAGENRLWDISRAFGSAQPPALLDLSADDRTHLEKLLRQSPTPVATLFAPDCKENSLRQVAND